MPEKDLHLRARKILENAPVGVINLDSELRITDANPAFALITGLKSASELNGRELCQVCPGVDCAELGAAIARGETYQTQGLSGIFGDQRFFDLAVWPVESEGAIAMFTDISDRVTLQQQREDFVGTLTHDLKTPILAANRALTLVMEGDFGDISEAQKEVLETIYQSNDALYQLVLTLLDVYRYDSGSKQLVTGPFDLGEVTRKAIDKVSNQARSRDIELVLDAEVVLAIFDDEEISRLIDNYLTNAIKYSKPGSKVTVTVRGGDEAVVSVQDEGKGISEEDKARLFQRFWQTQSGGRYYAGTGLGLYLCRRIADLHGGRVWCESELGKGARFSLALPSIDFSM